MFNKKPESAPQLADTNVDNKAATNEPQRPEISINIPGTESAKAKASNSIIDEWLTMTGDLESEGDILIKGKVRGNIKCKLLIIDEMATVDGGMVADQIVVRGTTKGTIRANRAIFDQTARVDSEIYHCSLAVEEGAHIKGALHYSEEPMSGKPVEKKSEPAPKTNGTSKGMSAPVSA
jgi:cytoskeletal protein CcmA (bactofilin family)